MWCVGKSTIFLRTKCHSPNYSVLLIIALKPQVEERFYTAALLLFYSPQESLQKVTSIHVSFLETISFFTKVVPTIQARMSVILSVFILLLTYFRMLRSTPLEWHCMTKRSYRVLWKSIRWLRTKAGNAYYRLSFLFWITCCYLLRMDGWMDHEFRRSLLTVVAKMEGLWDAEKEIGIVKAEQAKGISLEWKMTVIMIFILGINWTNNKYVWTPLQRISSKLTVTDFVPKSADCN